MKNAMNRKMLDEMQIGMRGRNDKCNAHAAPVHVKTSLSPPGEGLRKSQGRRQEGDGKIRFWGLKPIEPLFLWNYFYFQKHGNKPL